MSPSIAVGAAVDSKDCVTPAPTAKNLCQEMNVHSNLPVPVSCGGPLLKSVRSALHKQSLNFKINVECTYHTL